MVATTRTALFGTLASLVAAQTVDIFLPEYGRYQDLLVAQNVGEVWTFNIVTQDSYRPPSVSANDPIETSECRCDDLSRWMWSSNRELRILPSAADRSRS